MLLISDIFTALIHFVLELTSHFIARSVVTPLIGRAVARLWSDVGLSEKDGGGSFIGDMVYATGLYRSTSTLKIVFNYMNC